MGSRCSFWQRPNPFLPLRGTLPKRVALSRSHFSTWGARGPERVPRPGGISFGPAKGRWPGGTSSQPLNLPGETRWPQAFTASPAEQGSPRQDKLNAEERRSVIEGEYLSKTPQELLEQIRIIPKNAIFLAGMIPCTVCATIHPGAVSSAVVFERKHEAQSWGTRHLPLAFPKNYKIRKPIFFLLTGNISQ